MSLFESFWKSRSIPAGDADDPRERMANFTPRAQQVLALARKEAAHLNHNFVSTEHLLLGMVALGQGVAVNVLLKAGLHLEAIRDEIVKQVGAGPEQVVLGNIPYTPRVKKVLDLAAREARSLNHTYVGTEHVLLGLLREGDGVAARVLKIMNVDIVATRMEILKELDPNPTTTLMETIKETQQPDAHHGSVDTSKRYDVYCSEGSGQMAVYRNAQFKGRRRLLGAPPHEMGNGFLELEQADGRTVFLSPSSICKFCEHGPETVNEIIPPSASSASSASGAS